MNNQSELVNQKKVWDKVWSVPISYAWDTLSQTVFESILRAIGSPDGLRIAEAGSGTGKISLRLAKEGADVTLIDFSEKALKYSRHAFFAQDAVGTFQLADIQQTGLPADRYDLTWNAGVLEHFEPHEQVAILQEMARITKPGGIILVLTPNADCLPYRVGKYVAERSGSWKYGVENPVRSLRKQLEQSGINVLEESHTGFMDGLAFLDFIEGSQSVKEAIQSWYSTLGADERAFFQGYLLVTMGKVGT